MFNVIQYTSTVKLWKFTSVFIKRIVSTRTRPGPALIRRYLHCLRKVISLFIFRTYSVKEASPQELSPPTGLHLAKVQLYNNKSQVHFPSVFQAAENNFFPTKSP